MRRTHTPCTDAYVFVCIFAGALCLVASAIHFSLHATPYTSTDLSAPAPSSLTKNLCFIIIDLFSALGGLLCLFQALACCRKGCLTPGLTFGFAALLAGSLLGLEVVRVWNLSALEHDIKIATSFPTVVKPLAVVAPETVPGSHGPVTSIDVWGRALLGGTALVLALCAVLHDILRRPGCWALVPCTGNGCCSCSLAALIGALTVTVCTASALFLGWPDLQKRSFIWDILIEAPARNTRCTEVMVSLMMLGAAATWVTMWYRPRRIGGSCFRSILLAVVFVAHLSLFCLTFVRVDLPGSWKLSALPLTKHLFATSAAFLGASLIAHSCTGRPRRHPSNHNHRLKAKPSSRLNCAPPRLATKPRYEHPVETSHDPPGRCCGAAYTTSPADTGALLLPYNQSYSSPSEFVFQPPNASGSQSQQAASMPSARGIPAPSPVPQRQPMFSTPHYAPSLYDCYPPYAGFPPLSRRPPCDTPPTYHQRPY